MTDLYGSDVFSILVLSTKKLCFSFLKNVSVFQKICFKVKVLKTFKVSTDCHIKSANLLNGGSFWKSIVRFFRRAYVLSIDFKVRPLRKSVKKKANSNFAIKLAERRNHSFSLSVWWITFFKHLNSLRYDNAM